MPAADFFSKPAVLAVSSEEHGARSRESVEPAFRSTLLAPRSLLERRYALQALRDRWRLLCWQRASGSDLPPSLHVWAVVFARD